MAEDSFVNDINIAEDTVGLSRKVIDTSGNAKAIVNNYSGLAPAFDEGAIGVNDLVFDA